MTEPTITEPGVYDLPAEIYHADPVIGGSLSSNGAKKLLLPGCPAIFKAWRDGGSEHKDAFDFGRAAHHRVLGFGEPVVVVDADSWRSKAAQDRREEAYQAGHTPILAKDDAVIDDMAVALQQHPMARLLLDPASGDPERTLIWRDQETGVMCRALVDHLRHPRPRQRFPVVDYKTAAEVDPESIEKAIASYLYYGQGAWYVDGAEELGMSTGPGRFILIFQRKTAPHLVVCAELSADDIGRGHERNRYARALYRRCADTDTWPGYADAHVLPVHLPTWEQYRHDGASQRGDFDPRGVPE